jgi:hypothetical protein
LDVYAGLIKIEPQSVVNSSQGFIKIEAEAGLDLDSTYSPASLSSPLHSPPSSPGGGKIKVTQFYHVQYLLLQPAYIYCLASVFYLPMFWTSPYLCPVSIIDQSVYPCF